MSNINSVFFSYNPKGYFNRIFGFLTHKYIYTVTCLYDIPPYCDDTLSKEDRKEKLKEYQSHGGSRIFGWFSSLNKAVEAVENNVGDIHECSYKYAIIEKSLEGLRYAWISDYDEYWYEWVGDDWRESDSGKYVPIEKPEKLKKIIGWGIG